MKKIVIFLIIVISIFTSQSFTYAAESKENDNWVSDAFSATGKFLNETSEDTIGIKKPFELFTNIIKAVNRILIVVLAGLSMIALSVTGIRYILGGNNATQQSNAKSSLKSIFIGMAIGFGAFTIWKIAIAIVKIIIGTFGT